MAIGTLTRFAAQSGQLMAMGALTGTLTDSTGDAVGTVSQSVSAPAAIAQATCRVPDLTLGRCTSIRLAWWWT